MAKHRLINCEFVNAGSFKVNVSNKAKLLYFLMFTAADDKGFVDTTNDIINALKTNDNEFEKSESMSLLENTYDTALQELLDKGLIYEFKDNHLNKVHLIRHWYYHNKMIKGLWTNYGNFWDMVYVRNNEYILGKKPTRESNIKEYNINQDILNADNVITEKETPKQDSDELTEDDLPFAIDLSTLRKGNK